MRRAFEIFLGVVLLISAIVPALLVPWTAFQLVRPELPIWALGATLVLLVGLTWFCVVTGWRLLMRRERPGGGLLHPWFLYVGAFYTTWYGTGRGLVFGPEYAQMYHSAAAEYLKMARARRATKKPPPKKLTPRRPRRSRDR
jgi:hypothetical protein